LVAVTQRFCDAVTDQAVFRTIFAQADVDPGEFVVQPRLDQARLATTVTARVVDNRLASCAAPIGTPTTVDQPDARVTVDIDWKATGPLVTVQPDVVSGAAAATGSVKSTALNGAPRLLLGSSLFAELLRRSVP
jgi:hypothetical protein